MSKPEWGRRRSDNQPYPKVRGKEALPSGLTVVEGTRRPRALEYPDKLYHITSEEGLKKILETGEIRPLTNTGYQFVTSLTGDYKKVLREGEPDIWEGKNVIIALDTSKLIDVGVRPVEYLGRNELNRDNWWEDDRDFEEEKEFRSDKAIPINGNIIRIMRSGIKREY